MAERKASLIGWAAASRAVTDLQERVERLERDSHPPINLGPAIEDILSERGYVPLTPHAPSGLDTADVLHLHNKAWAEIEGEASRTCVVSKASLRRLLTAYAALAVGRAARG